MADPAQHEAGPRAAPGWYPDPELVNTQRYWDGERWLEHRAPAPQRTNTPMAVHSTGTSRFGKVYLRIWLAIMLSVLVVVMITQGFAPAFANGLWTVTVVFGSLAGLVGLVIWLVLRSRK